ncbi:MAG TPA: 4-hydroxy-tetrahydrodipicolinate synthase [Chroococcales cyanobacterium]
MSDKFKSFGSLLTAMVTPFDDDNLLDLPRAQLLAKKLIQEGSDGLVVVGTTGESPTLSHEEKILLFRAVREATSKIVIAGTGTNDTAASVRMTKEAEEIGVDGILLVNPYYNKPSQEGLYRHFEAIARATSLPVILYNHPGRTGVNLAPETVARLMDCQNIVGLKDASGSLELASQYLKAARPGFALYSGDDSLILPIMSLGGAGVISVASHVAGRDLHRMISLAEQNDFQAARAIHFRYFDLFKGLFAAPNPAPTKAALEMLGFPVGGVRLPLVALNSVEKATLRGILENLELPHLEG